MDNSDLSEDIVQEVVKVLRDALRTPEMTAMLAQGDCLEVEQSLQRVLRAVGDACMRQVMRGRAAQMPRPVRCAHCGGPLTLIERARERDLIGLVGQTRIARATYVCRACHRGHIPFDEALGLGSGALSPGLARVACRLGLAESFEAAADTLAAVLALRLPAGAIRRACEVVGGVAEAREQDAIARLTQGQPPQTGPGAERIVVLADGVMVHVEGGWHEVKIGRAAPLGPRTHWDERSGRPLLTMGPSRCSVGREEAPDFRYRLYQTAVRAGLGERTQIVVLLADGAAWIWNEAAAFFGGPGRELIEIVDIFHAYEHLWAVGHALFADTAACAAWVEPLKEALYEQGAPAVIAALEALDPTTPEAADLVRTTRAYFVEHTDRMEYPRFVARALPIGSGAIESLCKTLVEKRAKGAGMRWSGTGLDAVLALRALQSSGQWDAFWASAPLRDYERRHPHKRPQRPSAQTPIPTPHAPAAEHPPAGSSGPLAPPPDTTPPASPWRRSMILPRHAA